MNPASGRLKALPSWWYILPIIATTLIAYLYAYSAGFISWDDPELIVNNKDVHLFNAAAFFSKSYTGNYMPLTMLVNGLNWKLFGNAPSGYHLFSIIVHCINGWLVFILSLKLFREHWKALICALIFCLHPLQTESVAWVAETKTLLFACFFLCGLILYINYLERNRPMKTYCLVLVFFILSVLSKPAGVCFPLCLFCIDLISGKSLKAGIIEKLPFFMISLAMGLFLVHTQQQDNYLNAGHAFVWYQKIGYAGYALLSYLGSFLLLVGQSVIYPYPQTGWALIAGYVFIAAILAAGFVLYKKKQYAVLGILLFIFSNLVLVLQFVPFGEVLTADRYMYLPLLGFSWLLVYAVRLSAATAKVAGIVLMIGLCLLTMARSKVWANNITLYSDIVEKYPDSYPGLNSLGAAYMLEGDQQKAYAYLNRAIVNSPERYNAYYNRGVLNAQSGRTDSALYDFTKAITLARYPKAYAGRAGVYLIQNDYLKAIADAEIAHAQEPGNFKVNVLLANCYENTGPADSAIYYYSAAILLEPREPLCFLHRAILYGRQRQFEKCISDLDACLQLDPRNAEAYYWKGLTEVNLKKNPCADFEKAYRLGLKEAEPALRSFCR